LRKHIALYSSTCVRLSPREDVDTLVTPDARVEIGSSNFIPPSTPEKKLAPSAPGDAAVR